MVKCPGCGHDVNDLQNVSPDMISKELIESVDHGVEDMAREEGIEVCAECMDEQTGE